jgi:cell division protein FtsL
MKINSQTLFSTALVITVVISALALVSVRQLNRVAFYDSQKLALQRDDLSIEWRQLMAEYSTWRLEHNIEAEVRGEHKMEPPLSDNIQTIHLRAQNTEQRTAGAAQ